MFVARCDFSSWFVRIHFGGDPNTSQLGNALRKPSQPARVTFV